MKKGTLKALLFIPLPTLVFVILAFILVKWRISTLVQVDLTVDRAVFTIGAKDSTPIVNSIGFKSLTVEKFDSIKLSPEKLEVADPVQYDPKEDHYPESAWTSLIVTPPVIITGEDPAFQPAVTLEGVSPEQNTSGTLDQIWAGSGSEVTLEVISTQKTEILIKVDHQNSSVIVSIREPFELITNYARVKGITTSPYHSNSLTYRAQLPKHAPEVEITSLPHSLVLILTITPEKTSDLFKGGILVSALDFTRQNRIGAPETTLVKDGEITYPNYPKIDEVSIKPTDFLGLDRLEKFRIEEIGLDPQHNGIRLRLKGIAGYIKIGSPEFQKDYRLTVFDTLWQNPILKALFSIVILVLPTTMAAYNLYLQSKK